MKKCIVLSGVSERKNCSEKCLNIRKNDTGFGPSRFKSIMMIATLHAWPRQKSVTMSHRCASRCDTHERVYSSYARKYIKRRNQPLFNFDHARLYKIVSCTTGELKENTHALMIDTCSHTYSDTAIHMHTQSCRVIGSSSSSRILLPSNHCWFSMHNRVCIKHHPLLNATTLQP